MLLIPQNIAQRTASSMGGFSDPDDKRPRFCRRDKALEDLGEEGKSP